MKLLNNDSLTYTDLYVNDYKQNILINYELVPTSSRKYRSIDRGVQSDRYETEFTFLGSPDYISGILSSINDLRINNKPLILSDLDENFFGEHIDSSNPIT